MAPVKAGLWELVPPPDLSSNLHRKRRAGNPASKAESTAHLYTEASTMVVMEINHYEFRQAFIDANRGNNFSTEALELLYEHFDDLSEELGEPWMVDVIAICCDYEECTPAELITNYSLDDDEPVLEQLEAATTVVGETSHGTIVFANW